MLISILDLPQQFSTLPLFFFTYTLQCIRDTFISNRSLVWLWFSDLESGSARGLKNPWGRSFTLKKKTLESLKCPLIKNLKKQVGSVSHKTGDFPFKCENY